MNSITSNKTTAHAYPTASVAVRLALLLFAINVGARAFAQTGTRTVVNSSSRAVPGKVFLYNLDHLLGATGVIDHPSASFKTLTGPSGGFSSWTIVTPAGVDILFYDTSTGHATIGQVDAVGNFKTTQPIPNGQIVPGWTHITFHKGFYLFYCKDNGFAAVGKMENSGFHIYNTWNGSFSANWSSITSTPNGLLFYNKDSGSGEVADWGFVKSGPGFGEISQVNLNRLKAYPNGFDKGWTHVVNTSRGVLFYCTENGRSVMVDVDTDGSVTTRKASDKLLAAGYESVVAQNDDVLLYDKDHGDVAIAAFPGAVALDSGPAIRGGIHSAYFSPGWTNMVGTMDPQ